MKLSDGFSPRTENGTFSPTGAAWRSVALPALPPSRRERASRASHFASRVLATSFAARIAAPAFEPSLLPASGRTKG
jgi:hypothetical protein